MKPNYYTLIVFAVLCAALAGAHAMHLDSVTQLLMAMLAVAGQSLMPQAVASKGDSQ